MKTVVDHHGFWIAFNALSNWRSCWRPPSDDSDKLLGWWIRPRIGPPLFRTGIPVNFLIRVVTAMQILIRIWIICHAALKFTHICARWQRTQLIQHLLRLRQLLEAAYLVSSCTLPAEFRIDFQQPMLVHPRYLISILISILSTLRMIILSVILDQSLVRILDNLQFFFNTRHHMNGLWRSGLLASTRHFHIDVVGYEAVIEERVALAEWIVEGVVVEGHGFDLNVVINGLNKLINAIILIYFIYLNFNL